MLTTKRIFCFLILVTSFILASCSYQDTFAPVVDAWHDPAAMKSRYRVQPDDTIYSVALNFDLDYRDLARANHLSPPYTLKAGQTLTMAVETHFQDEEITSCSTGLVATKAYAATDLKAAHADNFQEIVTQEKRRLPSKKVVTPPWEMPLSLSQQEIYLPEASLQSGECKFLNKKQSSALRENENLISLPEKTIALNQDILIGSVNPGRWQWPAKGRIVKGFSLQMGGNKGIDIAGNLGDPVRAVAAGRVVYSGSGLRGYGNLVILKHSDNHLSAYAYNKKLLVREGDVVKAGAEIAKMGQNETGCVMLHFEIRRNGKPVNPLLYL